MSNYKNSTNKNHFNFCKKWIFSGYKLQIWGKKTKSCRCYVGKRTIFIKNK